jgi:hypothetical protein
MKPPTPNLLRRRLSVACLVAVVVLVAASGAAAWRAPPFSPSLRVKHAATFAYSSKVLSGKVATSTRRPPDTTPPVVTVPGDQRVEAQGPLGAVVVYPTASAFDAVDGWVSVFCSPGQGSLFPLGSTRVGCIARDKKGNVGLGFFTVRVADTTPPKVKVPAAIEVDADSANTASRSNPALAKFLGGAVATDVVDLAPVIATNAPSSFAAGTTKVVFTATDRSGNSATATSSVTVRPATTSASSRTVTSTTAATTTISSPDTSAPVVTVPPDQRTEAQGPLGASVSYPAASALDAIDGPVSVLCSPGSGSLFPLGSTRVGCSASDRNGNTAVAFFTVSVVDTAPPKLTLPAAIAVAADSASGTSRTNATVAAFLSGAVATDLVTATPTITTNAPSVFPVGTTTVLFTAADASGNRATASSAVTVRVAAPVVNAPPDQHVEAQGPSGATVQYPPATAVDALGRPLVALCSPGSGSPFPLAATQVACRATDDQGLSGLAFFTVWVFDTTPPKLTAPAAIAVTAESASGTSRTNATVAAFLKGAVATDLVTATPAITTNAPEVFPVGTTQVEFTASDSSGNKATATSRVTVQGPTTTTGTGTTTPAPTGRVLWRGDAETGDFSQWTGGGNCLVQASRVPGSCYGLTNCTFGGYGTGDGDIQIVSSPVHGAGSTKAYKHTIYQQFNTGCGGDNTIRADLYLPPDTSHGQAAMDLPLQGKEQYWHFAFLLPSVDGQPQQWAQYSNWNALGDMHPRNSASPYPVDFGVVDTGSKHFIYSEHIDESEGCFDCDFLQVAPLVYDKWIDVVLFIHWSTDPNVGHVTIWTNVAGAGYVQKFDKSYRTLVAGDEPYWKQALYTGVNGGRTFTNTIVYDGTCRGTSFTAVAGC